MGLALNSESNSVVAGRWWLEAGGCTRLIRHSPTQPAAVIPRRRNFLICPTEHTAANLPVMRGENLWISYVTRLHTTRCYFFRVFLIKVAQCSRRTDFIIPTYGRLVFTGAPFISCHDFMLRMFALLLNLLFSWILILWFNYKLYVTTCSLLFLLTL